MAEDMETGPTETARFAPKGWGAVLGLSRATNVRLDPDDDAQTKQVLSMMCPGGTTFMCKRFFSPEFTNYMTINLPERQKIIDCLKNPPDSLENLDSKIRGLMDLTNPLASQVEWGDLFLGYVTSILGSHVGMIPYSTALMMTAVPPRFDTPIPKVYDYLIDASVIVTFLSSEQGKTYARGMTDHYSPLIILWKEKKIFFIEPHGTPDSSANYYLPPNVMNGIHVMIAWLSLIKNKQARTVEQATQDAQGFEMIAVGLPVQYRQKPGTTTCMCVSCGVSLLFLKYFDAQHRLGTPTKGLPKATDHPGHYDFDALCGGERSEMTDQDVVSFQAGILRLALETMESLEVARHIEDKTDLESFQDFLKVPAYDRVEAIRNFFKSKVFNLADDQPTPSVISDPGIPMEILKDVMKIYKAKMDAVTFDENMIKHYSTSKLMILLMATFASKLSKTQTTVELTSELQIIFNAITDALPNSSLPACPPVPTRTVPFGEVTQEHFFVEGFVAPRATGGGTAETVVVSDTEGEDKEGREHASRTPSEESSVKSSGWIKPDGDGSDEDEETPRDKDETSRSAQERKGGGEAGEDNQDDDDD
jgi:hypothetical protein